MPLVCNNENLKLTNHAKLLGLIIDKNLQWTEHISQMCKKLSKINFALRILKTCSGTVTLKSVYFAHFQSILMYGIEFFGQAPQYLLNRVFKLQKQAIRILAGVGPIDSCRGLFEKIKILPLAALYLSQIFLFFKKYPHYMDHAKPTHNYGTRHKNNYVFSKHKTQAFEKGALYAGQIFYNKLPNHVKQIDSVNVFKNSIKLPLLELNLYCVDDFVNATI